MKKETNSQQPSKNGGESHDLRNNSSPTSPADIKEKLLKEIEEREKYCPEEFYEQGGKWNYTDILKAKLQQHEETSKAKDEEFIKILEEFLDKLIEINQGYTPFCEEKKKKDFDDLLNTEEDCIISDDYYSRECLLNMIRLLEIIKQRIKEKSQNEWENAFNSYNQYQPLEEKEE